MLSILCRNNLIRGLKVPPNATALMLASAHFSSGTKRLTILEDLRGLKNAPAPALTLGLSGLIPFLAAPWYMTYNLAYGASILSFLGGVRWGMLVVPAGPIRPGWSQYSYSVTPSLIAWTALIMPTIPGVLTCGAGLALAGYYDLIQSGYPTWFRGLRIILTSLVLFSLIWSLLCSVLLDEGQTKGEQIEEKKDEKNHL